MGKTTAVALFALLSGSLSGCATIVSNATGGLASALSAGILNQGDLTIVADGMPAYLLLVDGLVLEHPEDETLLLAGAELYSAYGGGFAADKARAQALVGRARDYGVRALCSADQALCAAMREPHEVWVDALKAADEDDVRALYGFAASYASWIAIEEGNWDAIAEVPKIEAAMQRIVAIDPAYRNGWPWLYLGVLNTQLPPAYGGKPEEGRQYFETALERSQRRNLMVHTLFARYYARLVFDQELHDQLLEEALAADPQARDLTLINTLAQRDARRLLDGSADYF